MGEEAGSDSSTKTDQPLVSVVVPAFNAEETIRETLESVSRQSYEHLEIIVVDDGSTDGTCDVVEALRARDSRLRLIRQANGGVGAARNAGIAAASGKYIAPIDADDVWEPEKTDSQVAVLEEWGDSAGFAYCWTRLISEDGELRSCQPRCVAEGRVFLALFFRNFTHNASSPMFRAAVLREVGGYATREEQGGAQGCEDWELCLRVAERYEVCLAPKYLVNYRVREAGMSCNASGMEKSFQWMVRATLQRQPQISEKLIRWNMGHFYLYLAAKARGSRNHSTALRYLKVATQKDFATVLEPRFAATLVRSAIRSVFPRKHLPKRDPSGARDMSVRPRAPQSEKPTLKDRLRWLPYRRIERSRFLSLIKQQAQ
jgi:glycosyltransferase involved in cell wall biosynthesis